MILNDQPLKVNETEKFVGISAGLALHVEKSENAHSVIPITVGFCCFELLYPSLIKRQIYILL